MRTRLEIAQLHQRLGTTMIFVTHDQVEAMTLADRIVVLNQGGIEQVGSPMDIYLTPRTEFVASFVGSPKINLLPVTVDPAGDRARARSEEHTSELQSLMRISYAVFCLKKKKKLAPHYNIIQHESRLKHQKTKRLDTSQQK